MQRRGLLRLMALSGIAQIVAACTQAPGATNPTSTPGLAATIIPTNPAPGSETGLSIAVASSLATVIEAFVPIYTAQTSLPAPMLQAGSSSTLAQQIAAGAAFDVLVGADKLAFAPLLESGRITKHELHACAKTALVVVAQPALALTSVSDITKTGTRIVVGDTQVPIGRYTELLWKAIAKRTGDKTIIPSITANIVSYEDKASSVVQKFFAGDADVAVVYRSDLVGRDPASYTILELPKGVSMTATSYALRLPDSKTGSAEFVNLLLDARYADIWKNHGFEPAAGA